MMNKNPPTPALNIQYPDIPTMESSDARKALMSLYLLGNTGSKSAPSSPPRRARTAQGKGVVNRFYAGGNTIYGVFEACPTLATLARIEAGDERRRVQLSEAQRAAEGGRRRRIQEAETDAELEAKVEEMFRLYIDTEMVVV